LALMARPLRNLDQPVLARPKIVNNFYNGGGKWIASSSVEILHVMSHITAHLFP
jgi:hypothetical protein